MLHSFGAVVEKLYNWGTWGPFGNQYTLLKDQLFLQPTVVISRCFYCSTTAFVGLSIVQEVEVQFYSLWKKIVRFF
jgi:hypothetical protein